MLVTHMYCLLNFARHFPPSSPPQVSSTTALVVEAQVSAGHPGLPPVPALYGDTRFQTVQTNVLQIHVMVTAQIACDDKLAVNLFIYRTGCQPRTQAPPQRHVCFNVVYDSAGMYKIYGLYVKQCYNSFMFTLVVLLDILDQSSKFKVQSSFICNTPSTSRQNITANQYTCRYI